MNRRAKAIRREAAIARAALAQSHDLRVQILSGWAGGGLPVVDVQPEAWAIPVRTPIPVGGGFVGPTGGAENNMNVGDEGPRKPRGTLPTIERRGRP